MPTLRDHPYAGFNFLVHLDGLDAGSVQAGFSRVSGLDNRVGLLRYRAGNDRSLAPRLYPGLALTPTVRLERGLIGDLGLYQWLETALDGKAERRDLRIDLLAEDRATIAQSWRLRGALPVALEGPVLDAGANEVAIETLVLVAESLSLD